MLSDVTTLPAVQLGDFLLQIELDDPSESVREIARRELRETPDVVIPAIEDLKKLLKGMFSTICMTRELMDILDFILLVTRVTSNQRLVGQSGATTQSAGHKRAPHVLSYRFVLHLENALRISPWAPVMLEPALPSPK